jgi:hypothetical protein
MQRFKKHITQNGQYVGMVRQCRERKAPAANAYGKFVYGANGTLTQAARWRDQAMRRVCGTEDRCCLAFVFEPRGHLAAVRELIYRARKGGFRLPA